jgi:ComF family protein
MPPLPAPSCSRCALPFATEDGRDHLCGSCLKEHRPAFRRVHAAGVYRDELRHAIQQFKYSGDIGLDQPLAQLMADRLPATTATLLIPVPLHRDRLRHRTYNQSLLLARILGRRLHLPVAPDLLRRTRNTPPQQGLPAEIRRRNLQDAFALGGPLPSGRLLLVDDVMTTGSTVRECARVLCLAGAEEVEVVVAARAGQGRAPGWPGEFGLTALAPRTPH